MSNEFDDIIFFASRIKAQKDPRKQLKALQQMELLIKSAIISTKIRIKHIDETK